MLSIHPTYNKSRLEKLGGMFDGGEPRRGNISLYVREHFDLKRVCEHCGKRTTTNRLAAASVIVEGPAWVLPISLHLDGSLEIDLESSIPDQSNFLSRPALNALVELGITFTREKIEYFVPIAASNEGKKDRHGLSSRIVTDASPDDVLTWDTEVEYDYESHCERTGERLANGYNVQTQYFQWLAKHGRLVLARISDEQERTLGVAYCVPDDYFLCLVNYKYRSSAQQGDALPALLFRTLTDYVRDAGLATPLKLGSKLDASMERLRPVPLMKQRLEIANRIAQQAILDCFGTR
jgi:hypothetical protein